MKKRSLKTVLYEVVFEADTKAGKVFDIALLSAISLGVLMVMLESVKSINQKYGNFLTIAEWILTGLFSIEYLLRIFIVNKPWKYIFSFYGIIDFFSVIPSFIGLLLPGTHLLSVIRSIRLLRVYRILNLTGFLSESTNITKALNASKRKIAVFLFFVLMLVVIIGTLMYIIEDSESGFTSIPQSIYWAVVTLTTVGYGDIAPVSSLGKFIAGLVMILGYAIIAVPTGIVYSEMPGKTKQITTQCCPDCVREGHDIDAKFCKYCGCDLNKQTKN